MPVQMINCCCCIPLKGGVVIITILWLVYGIYTTVSTALVLAAGKDAYRYIDGYIIPRIIICVLMTIGAAFGLFVVTCANTSKMLLIYSKIAYFYVAIDIIDGISGIVSTIVNRKAFLKTCSYDTNLREEACGRTYNSILASSIVLTIISILLSIYFAMVISAYAHKRKGKEDAQTNVDLPRTISHGQINDELQMATPVKE